MRRLVQGRPDTIALSARDRESTRALLAMIADRLEDRWKQAAMVPTYELEDEAEPDAEARAEDGEAGDDGSSQSTLEAMMGARHRKKATA